ncbi:MAG: hypothetical protein LBC34_03045, partial [Rickettsiales bacterium]|nr:hypothetical protein [Rickettsiales bacterium]
TASAATTVASAVPAAIALGNQLKELVGIINDNNIDNQDRKARVEEVSQNVENILQNNVNEVKEFVGLIASNQLENITTNINDPDLKALVDAVLQNNGEVAKKFIDLIASDKSKHFIINIVNSISDENHKVLVETVLQDNGKVAKRAIDIVASDGQLKNAVFEDINGENPGKAVEKIMGAIMQAINDIENGEKPST